MKKGENKKCFVCEQNGPQYFVMDFCTLVCTGCSGIHREFDHYVKHATLATWTKEEVDKVLKGGNKKAAKKYLANYNPKKYPRPSSSDRSGCRDFIQKCFVDKIWMDEDDEDAPRRKRRPQVSDDEDEDFEPRRKPMKGRRPQVSDDEDFEPRRKPMKGRRPQVSDDEDEDDKPRRKPMKGRRPQVSDDEGEEEPAKPAKKTPVRRPKNPAPVEEVSESPKTDFPSFSGIDFSKLTQKPTVDEAMASLSNPAQPQGYGMPANGYGYPQQQGYGVPPAGYGTQQYNPSSAYGEMPQGYGAAPSAGYGAMPQGYGATAPSPAYGASTPAYGASTPAYGASTPAYGASTPPLHLLLTALPRPLTEPCHKATEPQLPLPPTAPLPRPLTVQPSKDTPHQRNPPIQS